MRIFLTGGTGFIGQAVTSQLLRNGHSVLLLTRQSSVDINKIVELTPKIEILNGNLADIPAWEDTLRKYKPEATIHLAWEGIPDFRSRMCVANLQYGLNLYLTLAEIGCKIIITSGSCWEYGRKTGELSENLQPIPNNAFTVVKNALRMVGSEIAKEGNIRFIWTRFYYVYGPGQRKGSLIPSIIESVRKNQVPQIKTPNARNDFVYVDDVATALVKILQNCTEQNAIFNIGSGYSISIQEIVKAIYEQLNQPIPKEFSTNSIQNEDIVDFWANLTKIKKAIGWIPETHIRDGIKRMLQS